MVRNPDARPALLPVARRSFMALLALLLAGCGVPAAEPLQFGAAVWQDGERARYEVTDRDGTVVGTASIDVRRGVSTGPDGWTVRRALSALGDEEIAVTEVSEPGFRPTFASLLRTNNQGREQVTASFSGGRVDLELLTRNNVSTLQSQQVPSDTRELRSLALIVRALPLADGYRTRINTYLPVTGRLARATLSVGASDTLSTPAGTFAVWELRVDTPESRTTLWIGVDAPHPLVRMEDGRAVYTLVEFTPGPR